MEVCPYEVRSYIDSDPQFNAYWGGDFTVTPYEEKKTLALHDIGKVSKCNFCIDRFAEGEEPACVQTCITGCRMVGDLDDPHSEISIAIKKYDAKPLHEEYETEPSVYYVRPFE
jgi:molybdopterin-containing oxidoreductase family iron-sulfur binding subunit